MASLKSFNLGSISTAPSLEPGATADSQQHSRSPGHTSIKQNDPLDGSALGFLETVSLLQACAGRCLSERGGQVYAGTTPDSVSGSLLLLVIGAISVWPEKWPCCRHLCQGILLIRAPPPWNKTRVVKTSGLLAGQRAERGLQPLPGVSIVVPSRAADPPHPASPQHCLVWTHNRLWERGLV